jgi:hypothetical protein
MSLSGGTFSSGTSSGWTQSYGSEGDLEVLSPDGAEAKEKDGVKSRVCKAVEAAEATASRWPHLTGS